ncbi:MAG: hypothetical protein AABY75_03415, partial [Bacteroidota bacterium]
KNTEFIAHLTHEHRDLRRRTAEAEVRVHQMEEYKTRLQAGIDDLKHRQLELRGEVERKQARIDFLKGLVESYDGYSEGTRFLITDAAWKDRIRTTVGESLQSDPRFRIALENALGETVGYIIVDNADQAYAAMDYLKTHQKGKATFICLDRIPAMRNHRPPVDGDGVVGWARTLIGTDDRYGPLFDFLLESTLFVTDVPTAHRIVGVHHELRCVTLEGDIVTGKGVLKGGSARQDEGGHISKKTQLEELTEEVKELRRGTEEVQRQIREQIQRLEEVNLRRLQDEARVIEQEKVQVEVRIAQLEFEKKRAGESIERNEGEAARLDTEISGLQSALEQLTPAVEGAE